MSITEDPVDRIGRLMFGSQHRLGVALWLYRRNANFDDGAEFYADQYRVEGGTYSSSVAKQIETLAQLGMVQKIGRTKNLRTVTYKVVDSPLWDIVHATAVAVGEETEARRQPSPRKVRRIVGELFEMEKELRD